MWEDLAKIFRFIDLLSRPSGATKKEIKQATGTGERQFYRMIEAINVMGIPAYDDKPEGSREKVWHIEESYIRKLPNMSVPDPCLTIPEMFMLSFFKGTSSPLFRNTEIELYAESSYSKLRGFVGDELRESFCRMESVFIGRARFAKDYSGREDLLQATLGAILGRRKCSILYNSFHSGAEKKYFVHPLHFFEDNGGLYLLACLDVSGEIYTFAVERIRHIKVCQDNFDYPQDFNANEFINRSFGIFNDDPFSCSIWFSVDAARYINERSWSHSQTLITNPDGSVILTMETSGWPDVMRWVLSFGKDAQFLAPENMRLEIVDEIRRMGDLYVK